MSNLRLPSLMLLDECDWTCHPLARTIIVEIDVVVVVWSNGPVENRLFTGRNPRPISIDLRRKSCNER